MGGGIVRVERSIRIEASQRAVFEHVANHRNVLDFMHKVRRFGPIGRQDYGLGARFRWETTVRGVRVGWEVEVTEFEPHEWMAAEGRGVLGSGSSWRFEAVAGGTLATFTNACELPRVLLALPIAARLAERELTANMERSLRNLRSRLEERRTISVLQPLRGSGRAV